MQESDNDYNRILEDVQNGRNVILHGAGGCGKSYTIKRLANELSITYKVYVTALTGVAALNLSGGNDITVTTLHRFAGVGTATHDADALVAKIRAKKPYKMRWIGCEILIIDEISMLGYELFKKLDYIAKVVRVDKRPFGGIRLILSGDFLQLPPVKDSWVFLGKEWKELNLKPYIFDKPYRYTDTRFFELLSRIRMGIVCTEDVQLLQARVDVNNKIQTIIENASKKSENLGKLIKPTMFYAKRVDVDRFNQEELDKLPGDYVEFIAKDDFLIVKEENKEYYTNLFNETIPQIIRLKVGCQVMMRINTDGGLANGSRGVVSEIVDKESVIVTFVNRMKVRIEIHSFTFEDKETCVIRRQIPLILSYACTVHKAQGSTLDYCVLDIGNDVFVEGQSYVALSRCRTIEGLFISNLAINRIRADEDSIKYTKQLEEEYKQNK